ncbi:MAG: ATP-binding protein [Candidatus Limnocylindrales bacterium]
MEVESDAFVARTPPSRPAPAPVRRLFIANRGEIAARIARTANRLGIECILPEQAGGTPLDFLDGEAVVAAARGGGADVLHPGYGFLAESADFAAAVERAGIRWVGPPPAAIRAMGDKAAARQLAASLGIPTIPGYDGPDQTDTALTAAAARIGAPIIVKPAAGGGGKGMRVVRDLDAADLGAEFRAARRAALAAFGDDRLILEHLVGDARHVEVQVLFDAAGEGVALGDRDCSLQRRHQKILEEAPAAGLPRATRRALAEAAIRLGTAVGYRNVGTCEFLVDERGGWYFLEMNTRLQVEHPVTEAVTGRDLVADQLAIAAGATLSDLALDRPRPTGATRGHAIEVRLCAEDADADFLPATGCVEALRWPAGDGIRVEAGIELGTVVGVQFDPLLAKIVAHGTDRADALGRLETALDGTVVLGLTTNLRFLRWLVREPILRDAVARTDSLERTWPPADRRGRTATPDAAWSIAARRLAEARADAPDPFRRTWRLNAPPSLRVEAEGEADSESRTIVLETPHAGADEAVEPSAVRVGEVVHVDVGGRSVAFRLAPPPDAGRAVVAPGARFGPSGVASVISPMPGRVIALRAEVGDELVTGDPIVVLEAMKMEHVVVAPVSGRLVECFVVVADQVSRGAALATMEPSALP